MNANASRTTLRLLSLLAVLSQTQCSPPRQPENPPPIPPNGPPQVAPAASAPSPGPEQAAQTSAEAWLALMDAGQYGESWTSAASLFKKALDQAAWVKASTTVRAPLGKLESRLLKSRELTTTPPGAPAGEYVVLMYDSSFEHQKGAVETITETKDTDGSWRAAGYFIRPR